MFLFIIITFILAKLIFGGYIQSDNLALYEELIIAGSPIVYQDYTNSINTTANSFVSFDDHIFGIAYFRDIKPYASFIQNGKDIFGEIEIPSNFTDQHGIQSCRVNQHDMMVIYSADNFTSYAQMVTKEGNSLQLKGSQIEILAGEKSVNARCLQLSSNLVGIAYMAEDENLNATDNWGVYFNTYQVNSQTLGTPFIVNDLTSGFQGNIKLDKTPSGKVIILFQTHAVIRGSQSSIMLQELTLSGIKAPGRTNVRLSGQQQSVSPALFCDENDNTYIAFYDQQRNKIHIYKYSASLVPQCNYSVDGIHPNIVVYDNIIYLRFYYSDASVVEIYSNCTVKTAPRQEVTDIYGYQQDMAVSIQPSASIFAYITSEALGGTSKLRYTEYLLQGSAPCDNPKCISCYSSNTHYCRKCNDALYLTKSNGPEDCRCMDKYFSDPSDGLCKACNSNCVTCSNSNSCDSCSGSDRNVTNVCRCNDGLYDDASVCRRCNYKCGTCSDGGNCDTCAVNRHLDARGECRCDERFYDNSRSETCLPCGANCLQCRSNTECTVCEDGWYIDTQGRGRTIECKQCSFRCATCSDTATNCTLACPTECPQCDGTGKCTSCKIEQYLDADQNCNDCHPKCYSCQNQDSCDKCSNGLNRLDISHNCGCQDGYYEVGEKDCAKCKTLNCKKCDQNGDCLECKNSLLDTKDCQTPKFKLNQRIGFFSVQIDEQQMRYLGLCSPKCEKCDAQTGECLQCKLGKNRNSELPCNCLQGYHDQKGVKQNCEKCLFTCLECVSFYECTKCDGSKNRVLDKFKQACVCKEGYKENKKDHSCQQCYDYNGKCLIDCPSHTIKDDKYQVCKDILFDYKSLKLLFSIGSGMLLAISIILFILIKLRNDNLQKNSKGQIMQSQQFHIRLKTDSR